MILGIVGAENSHTVAMATILNIDKKIAGTSLDYVWGESAAYAKDASKRGKIPNIVKRPKDMVGKVDGVMVDHRHAKHHLKAVRCFIEAGVPTFVDKPFCYRSAEGKEFLRLAKRKGTPVTSFGVVPYQKTAQRFKAKLADIGDVLSATTYGACDLKSKWGGIFFYGIHQVELVLKTFGYDVKAAQITKNGQNAVGQILYPSGLTVTMGFVKEGLPGFGMSAVGTKGRLSMPITFDKSPYLVGVRTYTKMFRTGVEPLTHAQILKPVQVLEALEKSVKSGKVERVAK
jgi:predicted dehydrogenase